jgi:hypothetical protein
MIIQRERESCQVKILNVEKIQLRSGNSEFWFIGGNLGVAVTNCEVIGGDTVVAVT